MCYTCFFFQIYIACSKPYIANKYNHPPAHVASVLMLSFQCFLLRKTPNPDKETVLRQIL